MMADDLVVDVQGVSKRFCRGLRRSLKYALQDFGRELVTLRRPGTDLRPGEFWAVRNVSVQLRRGEAMGLIGRNGAGKTTLLRMIAGLIRPDTGVVRTRGRVVPLLALGAGFSPVLSGRENIVVNMSILGVPKVEIRRRLDDVIAFAEIDPTALDAPIRTYSSGMAARLGFACAVHTEPDILLVDEVLAVGDIAFRAKCYRKLADLQRRGTGFVLVSHNIHSVLSVCQHGVYLRDGAAVAAGDIEDVMQRYEEGFHDTREASADGFSPRVDQPTMGFQILDVCFRGPDGEPTKQPTTGLPATLCIGCRSDRAYNDLYVTAMITEYPTSGEMSVKLSAAQDRCPLRAPAGGFELRIEFPTLCLRPGSYAAKLSVAQRDSLNLLDAVEMFRFQVTGSGGLSASTFYQPRTWSVSS
jgi:lipopolysaccharide transport system ATP-binding protein